MIAQGNGNDALELLKRTRILIRKINNTKEKMGMKSLIYNSIACVYREIKENKLAVYYIEKAIGLAKLANKIENLGIIYLNSI